MIMWTILLACVILFIIRWYSQRKKIYQVFETLGIAGPQPESILFGNLPAMRTAGQHKTWADWTKKFGKTFGYFEGPRPVLMTSDGELLKHILVKDFQKFNSRKPFPLDNQRDKFKDLFTSEGAQWKRLRTISSPSFSGRRMKEMSPVIQGSISELLDVLETRCEKGMPFDIHGEFQRLTLTVIASCAFGIDVNALKEPDHVFLHRARQIFAISNDNKLSLRLKILIPLAIAFPAFVHLWGYLSPYVGTPKTWFLQTAKRILESRLSTKSDRVDFVRLMLDAKEASRDVDLTMTADDIEEAEDEQEHKAREDAGKEGGRSTQIMTLEEMQAQSMLFLLAGYETTSTALGFTAYMLALHPDVQAKLHEEIDEHFPLGGATPEYGTVQKLTYLDMVLSEVLRMYPIAMLAVTRKATEDCEVSNLRIPRGMGIQINMEAVHHDPDLWGPEDPNDFVPERFTAERKQKRPTTAWMPFGAGPRNCAGMRFALLETKLTLVSVLQNYVIERCQETQIPLPLNRNAVRAPSEGVIVRIKSRRPVMDQHLT